MQWLLIVQIIITVLYVGYLVYFYALPTVHISIKISVYLTWLLSFGIVVLLPFDIYYSMQEDSGMQIVWRVIYSVIMILTWLLLPIAQQYQSAGQFTRCNKLKRAIINNLIIYGAFALVGAAFLVYLLISGNFDMAKLSSALMAASTAFGMLLVVIFLSYGLVAIPKSLWRERNYQMQLKQNQFTATVLSQKKDDAIIQLQLRVKEAYWHMKHNGQTPEINYVLNLVPQKYRQKWSRSVPNLRQVDVVKIHKDIKQMTFQLQRLQSRWEQLMFQTFKIEDILTDINSPTKKIQSTLFPHFKLQFLNTLVWFWHCRLKLYLTPFLAILFSLFTVSIVIAQFAAAFQILDVINPFSKLLKIQSFIAVDMILLVVMAYISFCVFYALFKLKFANFYGLYWNQQTDSASLIFYSIQCSRVSTPLCYNFLQIVHKESGTSFSAVMGTNQLGQVFGQTFNMIFPIMLIILIIFNALDVYRLLANRLGMQKFQFENNFQHENIDQGKRILRKARTDLQTKVLNSNGKNLNDFRSYKYELEPESLSKMSKENSSFDQIQTNMKNKYFNQYSNMNDVMKIISM